MVEAEETRKRKPSDLIKRGYSETEVDSMYSLGRHFLECGHFKRAEIIFKGLNFIVPEYAPAWLGTCAVCSTKKEYELALNAASKAFQADPKSAEAEIYLACSLISVKDFNAAGTYLGEIAEKIDAGIIVKPDLIRFFRTQLVRYQEAMK